MTGFADMCKWSVMCGKSCGALTGLAIGIWVHVEYIQPAFKSIDGINGREASGITAGVALAGGLGPFLVAGACAGALAGPVVGCLGAGAVVAGKAAKKACNALPFFNGESDKGVVRAIPAAEPEELEEVHVVPSGPSLNT